MSDIEESPSPLKSRKHVVAIAIVSAVVVLVGSGGVLWKQSQSSESTGITYDTLSGLKQAKWSSNITRTFTADYLTVNTNDIPNHKRDAKYAVPNAGIVVPDASTANIIDDPTKAQDISFEIPLHPKYVSTTTDTPLGSIGLMISGSVLFNPYEGDGKTIAMSSNFSLTDTDGKKVWFVDSCSGHPTPNIGQYHYHALSTCISSQVDKTTGPSHIEGVALDGFPIYGPRDAKGKLVALSSLDRCNGIFSATPEYPKGIYHYVLPQATDSRSSIRCFHGEVDTSQIQQMPPMGAGPGR